MDGRFQPLGKRWRNKMNLRNLRLSFLQQQIMAYHHAQFSLHLCFRSPISICRSVDARCLRLLSLLSLLCTVSAQWHPPLRRRQQDLWPRNSARKKDTRPKDRHRGHCQRLVEREGELSGLQVMADAVAVPLLRSEPCAMCRLQPKAPTHGPCHGSSAKKALPKL